MKKVTRGATATRVEKKATATAATRASRPPTTTGNGLLKVPRPILEKGRASVKIDRRYAKALAIVTKGGDVARAYAYLEQAAAEGDGLSIYAIATWRLRGFHVKRNVREATRMLRTAANKDVAWACYDLAALYLRGIGLKQSYNEAARYYLRAFFLGDPRAADALEWVFYRQGKHVSGGAVATEFGRYLARQGR
jgi:TPR repeat protein